MNVLESLLRHGIVKSAADEALKHVRRQSSIRALELELGLREWDDRDVTEARHRLLAQVRYMGAEDVRRFVESEPVRLTGGAKRDEGGWTCVNCGDFTEWGAVHDCNGRFFRG